MVVFEWHIQNKNCLFCQCFSVSVSSNSTEIQKFSSWKNIFHFTQVLEHSPQIYRLYINDILIGRKSYLWSTCVSLSKITLPNTLIDNTQVIIIYKKNITKKEKAADIIFSSAKAEKMIKTTSYISL